jgi:hypothetical protein
LATCLSWVGPVRPGQRLPGICYVDGRATTSMLLSFDGATFPILDDLQQVLLFSYSKSQKYELHPRSTIGAISKILARDAPRPK